MKLVKVMFTHFVKREESDHRSVGVISTPTTIADYKSTFPGKYTFSFFPLVYVVTLVTVSGLILILSFLSLSIEDANFLHGLTPQ